MKLYRSLIILFLTTACVAGDTKAEPAKKTEVLRVMAYNIKHGRGMDGTVDLERTAAVISKLNPDLVALQEIDNNCKRSGNQDIAAELGKLLKMEHRFAKFMDYQGGEYGLAVLSKLPIKNQVRHQLPPGAEPRCALEISVQAKHWPTPLAFVSVHNDWTNEGIRVKQVTALLKAMEGQKSPVILAGDFNGTPNCASLKLLQEHGWKIQKKTRSEPFTFPSKKPKVEIDFLITRNLPRLKVDHFVVEEEMASDHRPIFAAFLLSK